MNILIIGSGGFIGKSLSIYFHKKGYKVFACDIFASDRENYFKIDPVHPDFNKIFEENKYDACINASGAAVISLSLKDPYTDFRLNTFNVFLILEAMRLHNPHCKYINLSSAAVYGNPEYLPIDEKHPLKPLSPYGWHKYQSEIICKEFYHIYKVPTCSIRIFSAFGPGLKKQLFWDLYQKAIGEKEICLYGTGKESRDFIYIDDLLNAANIVVSKGEFNGESLNISSGIETTIQSAAGIFFNGFDSDKKISFSGEEKKGDPINWRADITKITNLGFSPMVSFEEGIGKYISWLEEIK